MSTRQPLKEYKNKQFMLSVSESQLSILKDAAYADDLPLAVYVRRAAMAAAKRGSVVIV